MNKTLICFLLFFYFSFSQTVNFEGQFWTSFLSADNSSNNKIGYIPKFSFKSNISSNSFIDYELSYKIIRNYNSSNALITNTDKYRFWVRYANKTIDFRLGLQKISFGQSFIFRPLNWFDNIDYRISMNQTLGINAIRLKYNPNNIYGIWGWIIDSDSNYPSFGMRIEFSDISGEWGFSYHRDNEDKPHFLNQFNNIPNSFNIDIAENTPEINIEELVSFLSFNKNQKIGLDYRYDGNIGFYFEASTCIIQDPTILNRIDLASIGIDLTFTNTLIPVTFLTETMYSNFLFINNDFFDFIDGTSTAFNLNLNIDIINDLMIVSVFDWDQEKFYNYLKWSNLYDYFNIDVMLSLNPESIGNSIEFIFVYNH